MSENIIHTQAGTIIFNGGEPLPGCPNSWDEARLIESKLNSGIDKEDDEYNDAPRWSFDCGFKLDYDGPILSVSSRFYPPKSHYGATWDGSVTVYVLGKGVGERKFDCPTLEELKRQVEEYLNGIVEKMQSIF